jgi:hypothetical protein
MRCAVLPRLPRRPGVAIRVGPPHLKEIAADARMANAANAAARAALHEAKAAHAQLK